MMAQVKTKAMEKPKFEEQTIGGGEVEAKPVDWTEIIDNNPTLKEALVNIVKEEISEAQNDV